MTQIENGSPKELSSIFTTITETTDALKLLKCPTQHWDHILVHVIIQWMDSASTSAGDPHIGGAKTYPKYQQIKTWLEDLILALESIERCNEAPAVQKMSNQIQLV